MRELKKKKLVCEFLPGVRIFEKSAGVRIFLPGVRIFGKSAGVRIRTLVYEKKNSALQRGVL